MGLFQSICRQLAPLDLAFAYAGCSIVWVEPGRTPSHECLASYYKWAAALLGAASDDRRHAEKCIRGGVVCTASVAR